MHKCQIPGDNRHIISQQQQELMSAELTSSLEPQPQQRQTAAAGQRAPLNDNSQLNNSVVQTGTNPRTDGMEGQSLDACRLGFEFSQHDLLICKLWGVGSRAVCSYKRLKREGARPRPIFFAWARRSWESHDYYLWHLKKTKSSVSKSLSML